MVAFCQKHKVPHEQCGKVVVATEQEELPRLEDLFQRGISNGLKGVRKLGPEQIREIEPHAVGLAAIHVPEEGIVDYAAVVEAMASEIQKLGGQIRSDEPVDSFKRVDGIWRIKTPKGEHETKYVVTCAGLHSDRLVSKSGMRPSAKIVPFRG